MRMAYINNENGLSMTELLAGAFIMLIVLAGATNVLVTQQSILQDENDNSKVRAKGRLAIKLIAKEVRMAGNGLPPFKAITDPSSDPLPATVNSLSFMTNLQGVRTVMKMDPASGGAMSGDTDVTIIPTFDPEKVFKDNDKIVLYNPNDPEGNVFDKVVVDGDVSDTGTLLAFIPALNNDYELIPTANIIPINKYNDYTIFQDGNMIKKTIDGQTVILINDLDLSAQGLVFDFNGETDPAQVNSIGITLNMLAPNNNHATIEFHTDVSIRNSQEG
jgi:hypothetical protein